MPFLLLIGTVFSGDFDVQIIIVFLSMSFSRKLLWMCRCFVHFKSFNFVLMMLYLKLYQCYSSTCSCGFE